MMSKTHLTIGMASSLAVFSPETAPACCLAIIGGALGGVTSDIDIVKHDYKHDALLGQIYALFITIVVLICDCFFDLGVCSSIINGNKKMELAGVIIFLGLYIAGYVSKHRTFTHSLLAMILFSIAISCICIDLGPYYLIGFFSHLVLDSLNKKEISILWPKKKGICFKCCNAMSGANTALMYIGLITTVFLVMNSLMFHLF